MSMAALARGKRPPFKSRLQSAEKLRQALARTPICLAEHMAKAGVETMVGHEVRLLEIATDCTDRESFRSAFPEIPGPSDREQPSRAQEDWVPQRLSTGPAPSGE